MVSFHYTVSDRQGLHATNAMSLYRAVSGYDSKFLLRGPRGTADCKNMLALMSLGIRQGDPVEFVVEGTDESQAASYLSGLIPTIL